MTTTNHLGITLVQQSQSQKEVTVNTAFTRMDAFLNNGAKSRSTATPPGSPAGGDVYIVAASPTGAWAGQAGKLAYFDQTWQFIAPNEGMTLWVDDEDLVYSYNGSLWVVTGRNIVERQFCLISPANTSVDIPLIVNAEFAMTVSALHALKVNTGSLTLTIKKNGAAITGMSGLSVTSTPQTATATAGNVLAVNDAVTYSIASVSGAPAYLQFSMVSST